MCWNFSSNLVTPLLMQLFLYGTSIKFLYLYIFEYFQDFKLLNI